MLQLFENRISYTELCDIDISTLQIMQEIKEKELEEKVKRAKKEAEIKNSSGGNTLVNKAHTIHNSELKVKR